MNIYQQIEDWINGTPNPDGWCSAEAGKLFAACAMALRPAVCVEVGVWGGRSAIPVALALKEIGRGTLLAIDPWAASESIKGQTKEDGDWWKNQEMHDQVFERFMKTVYHFGVQNCVQVIRKKSDDVKVPEEISFLNLDGNHRDQALVDIKRFTPHVRVGGLVHLDDIGWAGDFVRKGAEWMKQNGFISLYGVDSRGEMFQRIK